MNTTFIEKVTRHWISKIIIGSLACVLGIYLIKTFITQPILNTIVTSPEISDSIQYLLSGFTLLMIYYLVYTFLEKRKLHELSLNTFLKDTFVGLLSGFGLISLCMLLLYFMGYYKASGFNPFLPILYSLTLLISAALLEEVIFRGIIYRILEERWGTHIALLQAIVFGVVHYGNENATITSVWFVIILGVVLSLLYTYTQKLWLPFFFHLSWNFAQIVYGTPLSGDTNFNTLLISEFNGPNFFIGSKFGIEDSFFSILFMTLFAIYLYWLCRKKEKLKKPGVTSAN